MEKACHIIIKFMLAVSIGTVWWLVALKVPVHADSMLYNVQPVLDKSSNRYGYFRYQFRPNQTKVIPFILTNNSAQTLHIRNTFNDGYSSANGAIAYDKWQAPNLLSSSLPRLTSMVQGSRQQTVAVPPHATKMISFTIKMPLTMPAGDVLGGLTSRLSTNNSLNVIQYATSILISHSAGNQSMKLSHLALTTAQIQHNMLKFKLANHQNFLVYKVPMRVQLTDNDNHKIVDTKTLYSLAPHSTGLYNIFLDKMNKNPYKLTLYFKLPHQPVKIIHRIIRVDGDNAFLSVYSQSVSFFSAKNIKILLISVGILIVLGYYLIRLKRLHK